jgi:hypothetical protein
MTNNIFGHNIYKSIVGVFSSHVDSAKQYNPTYGQLDHYAIAMNNTVRFDSDSAPIKIDNCCTQTISGYLSDFTPSTLKNVHNLHGNGFGDSKTPISQKGTLRWIVTDDEGRHRVITILNTYYLPNCGVCLLSPQHWAQEV